MSKAHGGWDTAFKKTLVICVILLGMFGPTADACMFNVNAWPVMADGEIIDLYETSPCIYAGLEAGVGRDILGHPRLGRPDIGPVECTRSPITQIPAFTTFGLVLLFGLMAAAGCMVVRRRRGRA